MADAFDYLMLGASHRLSMTKLLKGNVIEKVANGLPEDIHLIVIRVVVPHEQPAAIHPSAGVPGEDDVLAAPVSK